MLRGRRTRLAVVLAGMGGVGKSTMALWLAGEFRRRGRPVWWVNAADSVSLRGGIVEILRRLEAPEPLVREVSDAAPTATDRFWMFLADRPAASRKALLVFDNADVPSVLAADGTSTPADGAGWARVGGGIVTVVTTRAGDPRVWGGEMRVVPLKALDDVAAAAVLRGIAAQVSDPGGREAVELARRLGGLPLALHLAGTYLTSPFARWHTFADYRRALDTGQAAVAELDGERALEIDRRVLGDEHPRTLDAWADLAHWTNESGARQQAEDMAGHVADRVSRVLGARHPLTLTTRATLARTLAALGRLPEAERILRDVVAAMEQVLSDNDARLFTARRDLADVLAAQGHTRRAERIYRQVLRLQQDHLGPAHPETLKTDRLMALHAR